jgi:hypothetical protein
METVDQAKLPTGTYCNAIVHEYGELSVRPVMDKFHVEIGVSDT